MTDTATYAKSPATPNKNEWLMTGVVLASPSTGQIKAIMPIFNSYSDIKIENILPIDVSSLDLEEPVHSSADSERSPDILVSGEVDPDAKLHANGKLSTWRAIMRLGTALDMQHLSVMVGLASLTGALANIGFSAIAGAPAPQSFVIVVTAIGFLGGRLLSDKLRARQHG